MPGLEWKKERRPSTDRYRTTSRLVREAVNADGVTLRYWADGGTWNAEVDIPGYGTATLHI